MFSHVVIFWTDPAKPDAADALIKGANKHLKSIPGLLHFHVGRMATSKRPVVDQSYQVALNTVFASKQAQDEYQMIHNIWNLSRRCSSQLAQKWWCTILSEDRLQAHSPGVRFSYGSVA